MPDWQSVEYDPFADFGSALNTTWLPPQDTVERAPAPRDEWSTWASNPPPASSALDAPVSDNRDMLVQAPGQSVFPKQGFGLLLHPNAAGIYGYENRPPPEGDVVLPSGDAPSHNAYMPKAARDEVVRGFNDYTLEKEQLTPEGLRQVSYAGDVLGPLATGNARLGQPSSVEGVKDDFARRIQTMVGDMPPNIAQKFQIKSGVRTPEWNAEVYRRRGEVAPRTSRHSYGMAVDTTDDPEVLQWINATNGKYGVDYTLRHLPGEQNHLEMVDNGVRVPLPSGGSVRVVSVDHDPFATTAEVNKAAAPAPVAEPEPPPPPPSRRGRSALGIPGQDPAAAEAAANADLSQQDAVVVRNPSYNPKAVQTGVWTGGPPTGFDYPVSPTTNPFITPEYGIQSSPTNPVLDDRPPQIPPPYSKTRGKQSRYRPSRRRRDD